MKFLNLNRVLCISAHPDDTEYGALGSMIKFKDTQFDVVVLSNGGDFDESSGFNREKECTEIWNKLSNVDGTFAHKTYVKDTSEDDWVNYIEQNYNIGAGMVESDYDCILTTPKEDSHFEHRMVNNIAYALVRASDCGIVTYRTPSTLEKWIPNFHVRVAGIIERKVELLQKFVSQRKKLYFGEDSILDFHTNYICSKVGAGYVESFRVERVYG
jgi:LmbE family N-acetylglucosaminyl deacetylase|tara:strand:- start:5 stop:646 length:642 start_codon:yes stop_codon:yes gene_type:complete